MNAMKGFDQKKSFKAKETEGWILSEVNIK